MFELLKDPVSQVIAILVLVAVFGFMAWEAVDSVRDSGPASGTFRPAGRRERASSAGEAPRKSTVPDSSLERTFDPATGQPDALVKRGPCRGQRLSALDRAGCQSQYEYCRQHDYNAALFLEDYMRRRFARASGGGGARAAPEDGTMSREAAYAVLGLRAGASEQDIVKAYRALIKQHHPDHGGSHAKAARINMAKDVLTA